MTEGLPKNTVEQINTLDKISSNVELKSNEEINRLITETEETLSALMGELKRRQEDKMHHEIENLDVYMQEADISFKNLRKFIAMALAELRSDK
ncbi:hypothetical protein [Psychrobacter phenylpyruvicus]|uniref:Uncharacterized protein n=1 Tax=Psychrobacter phenylpyruvicus TaxID=29432 RepID=A0A379LME5_9GAMM|nr:hypothetical protein [Psychrobacter phenylpyruvicus]SUD91723.1 Uncharacterised protein [Psychrobacter phenylpyruvicus]